MIITLITKLKNPVSFYQAIVVILAVAIVVIVAVVIVAGIIVVVEVLGAPQNPPKSQKKGV